MEEDETLARLLEKVRAARAVVDRIEEELDDAERDLDECETDLFLYEVKRGRGEEFLF